MISIVAVEYHSQNWLKLLVESLHIYSKEKHELIIVGNSSISDISLIDFFTNVDVKIFQMPTNVGHGEGLNIGSRLAQNDIVMFLDADCHFVSHGWEEAFVELMKNNDVVAGEGPKQKPIRPACMCLKKEIAAYYDWRDTPGYKGHRITPDGYDVAIKAFHEMKRDGIKIKLLESTNNRYGTLNGEEWLVNGKPYIYHHWHGSHLKARQIDFPQDDLIADAKLLFSKIPWRIV